jgi:ADP-ribose pyrophosphatase YjhB (NUDIX family)
MLVIGAEQFKGTWGLPGGHLEFKESFEKCAQREVLEETGLQLRNPTFMTCTNTVFEHENRHYVTIFMGGLVEVDAEPRVRFHLLCSFHCGHIDDGIRPWSRTNAMDGSGPIGSSWWRGKRFEALGMNSSSH